MGRFIAPDTPAPGAGALTAAPHDVTATTAWRGAATTGSQNPQDLNRSTYANNNPMRYNDPSGHVADPFDEKGGAKPGGDGPGGGASGSSGAPANPAPLLSPSLRGVRVTDTGGEPLTPKGGGKGADGSVDGFRAVSRAEADDIAAHGFRPHPMGRSMEDKWFSESRKGAEWFRDNMPGMDDVVHTKVPKSVYDRSYKHPNIDGTGSGFCVRCDDLALLPKPK